MANSAPRIQCGLAGLHRSRLAPHDPVGRERARFAGGKAGAMLVLAPGKQACRSKRNDAASQRGGKQNGAEQQGRSKAPYDARRHEHDDHEPTSKFARAPKLRSIGVRNATPADMGESVSPRSQRAIGYDALRRALRRERRARPHLQRASFLPIPSPANPKHW